MEMNEAHWAFSAFSSHFDSRTELRRLAATRCRSGPRRGNTALRYAAYYGHGAVAELLLQHKADVGAKTKDGPGALEEGQGFLGMGR